MILKKQAMWLGTLFATVIPAASIPQQAALLRELPLRFEERGGHYIARGPGFLLNLTPSETSLRWKAANVRTRFLGAKTAEVEGLASNDDDSLI